MSRLILALLAVSLTASSQVPALAPATPPPGVPGTPGRVGPTLTTEQTATIMKQLEQLEGLVGKNQTEVLGAALAKFKAALAGKDVLSLYLDCYRLIHFERKDLKQTDFQAWKDANEAKLKDKDYVDALALQLEYLILTIQAQTISDEGEMSPVVTGLQAFIAKALAAFQETVKHTASGAVTQKNNFQGSQNRVGTRASTPPSKGGGKSPGPMAGSNLGGTISTTLRQSVQNCEFSEAYLLDGFLKRDKWSYTPMDFAGIYQQVIFPYYLEVKPAELPAQWDTWINTELALRKITMSDSEYAVEFKERQPRLLWQRANYLYAHNVEAIQALADMLKIIRENPTHPDAAEWLTTLREAVNQSQPAQAPSPGAAPTTLPTTPAGS